MMGRFQKTLTGTFLLFVFIFPIAFSPLAVSAEGVPVFIVANPDDTAKSAVKTVKDVLWHALLGALATALMNVTTYAADKVAYDAAVFISSGGNGGDPLFDNRSIKKYTSDFLAGVAGEALGSIDEAGLLGSFKLCDPDATVTLAFKLGVKSLYDPPEPKCDFSDIKKNWTGFLAKVQTTATTPFAANGVILTSLADVFSSEGGNDISTGIQLTSSILAKSQIEAGLAAQKNISGGGFQDKVNTINQKVETPQDLAKRQYMVSSEAPAVYRNEVAIQSLSDKDVLMQVGKHAASVFLNTVLSKGVERLYSGLFKNIGAVTADPFSSVSFSSTDNAAAARESFKAFLTAVPLSVSDFSLLGDFGACPGEGKGLYNCVADSSFISAVSRAEGGSAMTVQEAIDEGLLNSGWPLISSEDSARDQDAFCYTYGYCHGNLVKLRKARIISTGWELAAESANNNVYSPITLGEVVDAFNDCNDQGVLDENHPWCHLIDPNWILKYPISQCKAEVYGQQLVSSASDERTTECVDMPSCISEDSTGACTGGYGYCVREANTWEFRGETCSDYYGSCMAYTDVNGDEKDYLANTTDSGNCDADNAGCLWYQTTKTVADDGTAAWPDYTTQASLTSVEAGGSGTDAEALYRNRMYFTSVVATCTADDAGCKELASRDDENVLNMVANPSFENDDNSDGVPDGWFAFGTGATYTTDSSASLDGSDALTALANTGYSQPGIVLTQGTEYTFSYYVKSSSSTSDTSVAYLSFSGSDGAAIDMSGFLTSGCSVYSTSKNELEVKLVPTDTEYARATCTFTAPTLSSPTVELSAEISLSASAGTVSFDEVQLEQSVSATDYHTGYSASTLSLSYMKLPPAYLGCTGNDTDAADCANYATMCSAVDVGCSAYTPSNGDPLVDGIVDSTDSCPSECVGYDTFKQEATLYEPDGNFPEYFIPSSAQTCSASEVGCDEFTNIATEGNEYFTDLRACLTTAQAESNGTDDGMATFYTWEGSDTSGYQLKTWNLVESNMTDASFTYPVSGEVDTAPESAPCSRWSAATASTTIACEDTSSTLSDDTADCTGHDDTITNPDCREFYDVSGVIHYRDWSKTVTVSDSCVTYRKTEIVGDTAAIQQTNCENSGGAFDTSTASCRYFGLSSESSVCSEAASGCRQYTGGRSANSRQAFLEYFEDGTLTNWDSVDATSVTLSNESIATDGHSLSSAGKAIWTYVGGNALCADEDGCASTTTTSLGGTCTVGNGSTFCGTLADQLYADKTYTISFWAKGTGKLDVGFDTAVAFSGTTPSATIDASFLPSGSSVTLDGTWRQYSYGPLDMNSATYASFGNGSSALVFKPSPTGTVYIDNVLLKEGEDEIDVIKNSWVTPASCDQTFEGTSSPQFMLGCQEYTDQNGEVVDLKSFSSLCSDKKVGCAAYTETQESDATTAAVYGAACSLIDPSVAATAATSCYYKLNADSSGYDTTSPFLCTIGVGNTSCTFDMDWYIPAASLAADATTSHLSYTSSTVVSPADKDVFVVADSTHTCSSDVMGCMNVGLPVFAADHRSIESWTDTYLLNIPEDYSTTLCSQADLFCNAFVDSAQTTHYFKDPQSQTCEYRTGVTIDGVSYDGWFKTGVDEICATNVTADDSGEVGSAQYLIGGSQSGIWRNGDENYAGWVGTCTSSNDMCTEFQDLADLDTDQLYGDVNGKSYYYLNNDALDESSLPDSEQCNGQVSQKLGCAMFNNNTDSAKTMNMSASYISSRHADALFGAEPNSLVEPIDCSSSSTSTITAVDGTSVDLCANRCVYEESAVYDLTKSTSSQYVFDGSCYTSDDCRPLTSESGETVEGSCDTTNPLGITPRLENDANMVIKTNRDRQCAEWLSCSDSQTVWDERTNSYRTVCADVGLCTEYSGTGDASFCSAWKTDGPAVKLDKDLYASRDVSWYGEDYSGLAIPNLLPSDQLTQINVAAPGGTCLSVGVDGSSVPDSTLVGEDCSNDGDCGATTSQDGNNFCSDGSTTDYRLAYVAGGCSTDAVYGDSCTVGYCENTGSPCVSTSACGAEGGSCLVGTCYDVSSTACTSDDQCSDGDVCQSGKCSTPGDDATIENYNTYGVSGACDEGAGAMTLYESVNFAQGTCLDSVCALTPNGETFDVNASEGKVCRGYPELSSPFPNSIVSEWQDPTDQEYITDLSSATSSNTDAVSVSFVQNFEHVQTCALGEDCECNYNKVEYGSAGALRYRSPDVATSEIKAQGICTAGYLLNASCSDDAACNGDSTQTDGACTFPSKIDSVIGMDGYCLERDSSTNILGDRNLNACLSWLPIDQLAGSTDIFGKNEEAGFVGEAEYCGGVGLYSNVGTFMACAEIRKDGGTGTYVTDADNDYDGDGTENAYDCKYTMVCPEHFFAVGGAAYMDSSDTNSIAADSCKDDVNACPYRCIPMNSVHTTDSDFHVKGDLCQAPGTDGVEFDGDGFSHLYSTPSYTQISWQTPVYFMHTNSTDSALAEYSDCVFYGNTESDLFNLDSYPVGEHYVNSWGNPEIDTNFTGDTLLPTYYLLNSDGSWVFDADATSLLDSISNVYPGCSSLIQVGSEDTGTWNYAWTDRVANANTNFAGIDISDPTNSFSSSSTYVYNTNPTPYGLVSSPIAVSLGSSSFGDPTPIAFPACGIQNNAATTVTPTLYADDSPTCSDEAQDSLYPTGSQNETLQGREYVSWDNSSIDGVGGLNTDETASSVVNRLNQLYAKSVGMYGWDVTGYYADSVYHNSVDEYSAGGPLVGSYGDITSDATDPADFYGNVSGTTELGAFKWDVRVDEGHAPQVWAVDTKNCYNDYCEEDQLHSMTINDQNEGQVTGDKFYRAYLKFFMAADKNQLPLRRVIVDWGDGSEPTGSSTDDNFYKNHRGLQPGTQTSICDTAADASGYTEWGKTPDSCDPNYVSYTKIYTCNLATVGDTCVDADGDNIPENTPCKSSDGQSCVYRPAVHVRDNWGFCGGSCTDPSLFSDYVTPPSDGSCFDTGSVPLDASSSKSECAYQTYNATTTDDGTDFEVNAHPWIYYDGTIVVTP